MAQDEFLETLAAEGFAAPVTVQREANGFLGNHAHPFEARALILDGEILLRIGETEQVYRKGQVFHLLADVLHSETYGPEGVKYLVGRK